MLIASRLRFRPGELPCASTAWSRADFDGLTVYGVYFPQNTDARVLLFSQLADAARAHDASQRRVIAIGDFNAGDDMLDIERNRQVEKKKKRPAFTANGHYGVFSAVWPDAWRALHPDTAEFSWSSNGRLTGKECGWRIDHAFASAALMPDVISATYEQQTRAKGLTDHAALVIEIRDHDCTEAPSNWPLQLRG